LSAATLYIFSGLPASGKTTLARILARHTGAMYMRIDTVEKGLTELCNLDVDTEGYRLCYRIIRDNLKLGNNAIADSCNTVKITREEWENVAIDSGAAFYNIEISCSDPAEHESRVVLRNSKQKNASGPTWEQVQHRYYEEWDCKIVKINTSGKTVLQSYRELAEKLGL